MKKLTQDDLLSLREYRSQQPDQRRRIADLKRNRRMPVGDKATLVFENRDTVWFQVQEMLLAELITEPKAVEHELDTYNPLIPEEGELSATLFVEIADQSIVRQELDLLVGLHEHVWLKIGDGDRVRAWFEPGAYSEERLAAVQYIKFRLSPSERAAFCSGRETVAIVIDHPNYQVETVIPGEVREALAGELG